MKLKLFCLKRTRKSGWHDENWGFIIASENEVIARKMAARRAKNDIEKEDWLRGVACNQIGTAVQGLKRKVILTDFLP